MRGMSRHAIIGAGPSGLAAARALSKRGLDVIGFERHSEVGGLWDIDNPHSTVYESAHLISSKRRTEFAEFPMADAVADYPDHRQLAQYFRDFAERFSLYDLFQFDTAVEQAEPLADGWRLTTSTGETYDVASLLIANGNLHTPNRIDWPGEFAGRIIHSSEYKKPQQFAGERVLIVGAGNSGCDMAVDAVHHADHVDISVRRGYHFVPKYVFGKPADAVGGKLKLPGKLKAAVDARLLKMFTGDPTRFGFPEPDHKLYESHPIVNSNILYHLGHGDLRVQPDVASLDGQDVVFTDGSRERYSLIVQATGYRLDFPFIDHSLLNWHGAAPDLYLNAFHPDRDDLFIVGMVEAAGIGWEGRMQQAELVADFIQARSQAPSKAARFAKRKAGGAQDMSGPMNYIKLDRMAYYVHRDTFLNTVAAARRELAA